MAEPSWIGFGGLAASAFSALAAYLAIRQTIIQRRISIKPQLIVNDLYVDNSKLSKNNYTSKPLEDLDLERLRPSVVNAGSGAALNINIEWSYPQEKKLEWLSSTLKKIKDSFSLNYSVIQFRNKKAYKIQGGLETIIYQEHENEKLNFILPLNVEKEPTKIKIPILILNTIFNEANFMMLTDGFIDKAIHGPSLIITYQDVEGNKFKICYASWFIVHEFASVLYTNRCTGHLKFDVVKQDKTSQLLQKIRKSYAAFMSEHDFNKNR